VAVPVISDHWSERFLLLAKHVAQWSKDPSTRVGAVIVDDLRHVVSVGYNGFPRGIKDDHRLTVREEKYPLVVHAEANAILNATVPVRGCHLYLWPFPPCSECAKLIIQSGILMVHAPKALIPQRWAMDVNRANLTLLEADIPTEFHGDV